MTLRSFAFLLLAACGASGDPLAGETVYGEHCASCHGVSGEGESESGVDHASDLHEVVPGLDDAHLREAFDGVGDMPAIQLSSEEEEDVVAYLRQEFGEWTGESHNEDDGHDE